MGLAGRVQGPSWERNEAPDPDGEKDLSQRAYEYARSCSYFCGWARMEAEKPGRGLRAACQRLRNSRWVLWELLCFNPGSKDFYRACDGFRETREPLELVGIFSWAKDPSCLFKDSQRDPRD